MSSRGDWCWSLDGETWTPVASREEAISAAKAEAGVEVGFITRHVFVAQCSWASHADMAHGAGEVVREWLADRAYDVAGEHADNYPDMQDKPFDEALEAFVLAWLKDHVDEPRFFEVTDEEKIELEG